MKIILYVLMFVLMLASVNAALTDGLYSYWSMDDVNISYSANILNGENLSWSNASATNITAGVLNNSRLMWNSCANTNVQGTSAKLTSLCMWVKQSAWSVDRTFIGSRNATGDQRSLSASNPSGSVSYTRYNSGNNTNGVVNLSEWTHVCATENSTNGGNNLYVNGVMVSTAQAYIFPNVGKWNISIGALNNGGVCTNYWNGYIDEIAFYNRTINSGEVALLYNNGTGYNPFSASSYTFNVTIIGYGTVSICATVPH